MAQQWWDRICACSMKVRLTPATAKGYSHCARSPSLLPSSRPNSAGSSCNVILNVVQKSLPLMLRAS